jgi:hypothetical protein
VKDQENELTDHLTMPTLAETYLHFIHHFLRIIVQPLLFLQSYSVSPTELNDIMIAVKSKLEHRITKKFFGVTATKSIFGGHLTSTEKKKFQTAARALKYLAKGYDCENSPFVKLAALNVKKNAECHYVQILEISDDYLYQRRSLV